MRTVLRGALSGAALAIALAIGIESCESSNRVIGPMGNSGIVADSTVRDTAPAGTVIPVGVTVYDDYGGFVRNATVHWMVMSGGGSVSDTTTQADINGHATMHWTLGPAAGTNTLNVSASGEFLDLSVIGAAGPTSGTP